MLGRIITLLAGLLMNPWAWADSSSAGGFKDPLDTAAPMTAIASSARLTAVARAGRRLIAVGPMGRIVISEDDGKQWTQVPVPVSSDLVAVRFATSEHGWAVGHDGVVLHTPDGGRSWVKQLDGREAAKIMAEYYGKRAQAGDAEALKILDEVKRMAEDGPDKPFLDVLFVDSNRGFVIGAFNLAFSTKDGGATWTPLLDRTENPKALHLYALAQGGGELYMAGEQGLIRRWNEKRERFEVVDSPYGGSYFGILANDASIYVFGIRGNAYRSIDHGSSWTKLAMGFSAGITAGTWLSDGRLVLANQAGGIAISSDGASSFKQLPIAKATPFFGIAQARSRELILVGPKGVRTEAIQ